MIWPHSHVWKHKVIKQLTITSVDRKFGSLIIYMGCYFHSFTINSVDEADCIRSKHQYDNYIGTLCFSGQISNYCWPIILSLILFLWRCYVLRGTISIQVQRPAQHSRFHELFRLFIRPTCEEIPHRQQCKL